MLFLFSSLSVSGLSTWRETATDFPSGQNLFTAVQGGNLVLDNDPALPGNWTRMGDLSSPPPRAGHSLVYDSVNDRHILFGGVCQNNSRNDTWSYDAGQEKWTPRSSKPPEGPWRGQSMAFDGKAGVAVLYSSPPDPNTYGNFTWTYNLSTDAWTDMKPPTSIRWPRAFAAMAYDSVNDLVVLFGGEMELLGTPFYQNDTWAYHTSTNSWLDKTLAARPDPRSGHTLTYDPANGVLVLFGGHNDTTYFRDTWAFSLANTQWTNRNPPTSPPARAGHSAAYDAASGTIVLFGGENAGTCSNDTWAYNYSSNTWTRKLLAAGPSPRHQSALSYDPGTRKLLLFGGQDQSSGCMDDTWTYDYSQNSWSFGGQLSSPEPRIHHSMAYDSRQHLTVLFGGRNNPAYEYDDTWLYDASKNLWTRKRPSPAPMARHDAAMAYDSVNGVIFLFGGLDFDANPLNDSWTYNVSTNTWTERHPSDPPPAGSNYLMDFDRERGLFVAFCGRTAFSFFNATWSYDAGNDVWTNLSPPSSPPTRDEAVFAYDGVDRFFVLHGGSDQQDVRTDTWTFDPGTNNWTERHPPRAPPGRTNSAMAFDAGSGVMILFGGMHGLPGMGDTWSYSAAANLWTDLAPAVSPAPRFAHDLVFDEQAGVMVLFGGMSDRYQCEGDTWLLGLRGRFASGTYTSRELDTGGNAYFGNLQWEATSPPGTTVRFQLRTGATGEELEKKDFAGPDRTAATYYTESGVRIPMIYDGSRWIQYRARLDSASMLDTPTLRSVTISYNLLHSLMILSPSGGENWTGFRYINWSVADPDNDAIDIDIYLLDGNLSTLIASGIPGGENRWLWPTDDIPNGTYRLMLSASDRNAIIPLTVNATSAQFTVHHEASGPPPEVNHPPVVLQAYPANGAVINTTSVRLQWNSTDSDGDPLIHSVYLENSGFSLSNPPLARTVTSQEYFTASGLTDNRTYYWGIIANDTKANGTSSVWSFTVRVSSTNRDPRITSVPPSNATVGVEYVYQVKASDPDGDPLSYLLVSKTDGMAIDSTAGRLNWTPRPGQKGNFTVILNVLDGKGGAAVQSFVIRVVEAVHVGPICHILYPPPGRNFQGMMRVAGSSVNGTAGVVRVQVRIDGGSWMEANGTVSWSLDIDTEGLRNGHHFIEARAFDGTAYSETSSTDFWVRNPEPAPSLGEFPWGYVLVLLWLLSAFALVWDLRRHPEGGPPLS